MDKLKEKVFEFIILLKEYWIISVLKNFSDMLLFTFFFNGILEFLSIKKNFEPLFKNSVFATKKH